MTWNRRCGEQRQRTNGHWRAKADQTAKQKRVHFSLPNDDVNTDLRSKDVATDTNDNIFVLTELMPMRSCWIYKLTETGDPYHRFRLRRGDWSEYGGLSVCDTGKVLTVGIEVEEYDTNGELVRSFGEGILDYVTDVTVANDGRVMVVDRRDSCVHIFSEHGDHLNKFKLQRSDCFYTNITFHRTGDHVVIAGVRIGKDLQVEIYSKDVFLNMMVW